MSAPRNEPPSEDGFVGTVREAALPLLVWATHFGFAYVWLAFSCAAGWAPGRITAVLLCGSVLAALWLVGLLVVAARRRTRRAMRAGAAALALVAVAWVTWPMLSMAAAPCREPVARSAAAVATRYSWLAASWSSALATARASAASATGAPVSAAEPSFLKRLTHAPASRG